MPTGEETFAMMQSLLTDRFQFQHHFTKKEMSVYALVAVKSGIKLADAKDGPCNDGVKMCGNWSGRGSQIRGTRLAAPQLADALTFQLGRIVIDRTGYDRNSDLLLTWSPDPDAGAKSETREGASIFTAIQEQLGLKLETVKAPIDVLVIDHIEKPSEN
jgi:uncharacterized protein (TIGR03435 family)